MASISRRRVTLRSSTSSRSISRIGLTAAGIVLGLGASWGITKWLATLLFDVSPHDPATFASIAALRVVVAFMASYLPGRRATRVDPVITLRAE